jgi:hypothetical protein
MFNLQRFDNTNRGHLRPLSLYFCFYYFKGASVAIVGQPATLPVLVSIVPIFYSTA